MPKQGWRKGRQSSSWLGKADYWKGEAVKRRSNVVLLKLAWERFGSMCPFTASLQATIKG
jgi:hypothetical protein